MNENFYLVNPKYSTTFNILKKAAEHKKDKLGQFEFIDFLPVGEGRIAEGGLRLKGFFSYKAHEKPLITIVTVVLNGVEFIEECIFNVIQNTYKYVEFIVVDGGSTDGTVDLLKKYDNVISYWVSERDRGIYDGMNKAVGLASGDFVYFLGVDDRMAPNAIHKIVDSIVSKNLFDSIVYGDVYMPGKHTLYAGKFTKFKLAQQNICHQAIFYPRAIFGDHRFDLRYRVWADYELNIRLFAAKRFHYLPVLFACYNDSGYSSTNRDSEFLKNRLAIINDNFGRLFFYFFATWAFLSKIKSCILNRFSILYV